MLNSLKSRLQQVCPSCSFAVNDVSVSSIGTTFPAQAVSYLQAHPSVNYIVPSFGDLTLGLAAALKAAGLSSKVKVLTQSLSAAGLKDIQDGGEAMNLPEPDIQIGWTIMDALVRKFEQAPLPQSEYANLPALYVTKSNASVPAGELATDPEGFVSVPTYKSQFEALWHLKS
jgi:ABC-type sugar transport system substrate-binding protein